MEHRICIVRWKLLLLIAVIPVTLVNSSLIKLHRHSKREIVSSPEDQVALVGKQVHMECRTSLKKDPMTWYFSSSDGSFQGDIYYAEVFIDQMKPRYQMNTNGTGRYSLVIPRVDRRHAGQYRCDDDEGLVKGKPVELTVLDGLPACTVSKSNPNNLNCRFEATGSLEPKITCGKGARQAERKNNVHSFSGEFDPNNARTCLICFTKGTTEGCVFKTGFEGIPESLGKTTLPAILDETPAPWISDKKAENGTIVVAVIMTVIVVVIIAAIVVVAIKRKALRRRMTGSEDPETPDDTGTALNDNHRNEFQMSPSLSTESGNSETPLNPNGRDA